MRKRNNKNANQTNSNLHQKNNVNKYPENSNLNTEFAKDFEECCGVEFSKEFEEKNSEEELQNRRFNDVNLECAREFNQNSIRRK